MMNFEKKKIPKDFRYFNERRCRKSNNLNQIQLISCRCLTTES